MPGAPWGDRSSGSACHRRGRPQAFRPARASAIPASRADQEYPLLAYPHGIPADGHSPCDSVAQPLPPVDAVNKVAQILVLPHVPSRARRRTSRSSIAPLPGTTRAFDTIGTSSRMVRRAAPYPRGFSAASRAPAARLAPGRGGNRTRLPDRARSVVFRFRAVRRPGTGGVVRRCHRAV
jgi:hypothetical protein